MSPLAASPGPRLKRRDEANRKRSGAAQERPRSEAGPFEASDVSHDTRLDTLSNWERFQIAQATKITGIEPSFRRRGATPVPNAPSTRPNRGRSIIIGATMRRRGVWRSAGPTSRPWSFETVTAGGAVLRAPCPNMTGCDQRQLKFPAVLPQEKIIDFDHG